MVSIKEGMSAGVAQGPSKQGEADWAAAGPAVRRAARRSLSIEIV